jgi:micrococcal nuclease
MAQPYGAEAKEFLSSLVLGATVAVNVYDIDMYGRSIGTVFRDTHNINTELVRAGYAWVYTAFNKDLSLPSLELDAKLKKLGLWAQPSPTPPWRFQHGK